MPDQLDTLPITHRMAQLLLARAGQPNPSWGGALGNALAAGLGGYFEGQDERARANSVANAGAFQPPPVVGPPPVPYSPPAPPVSLPPSSPIDQTPANASLGPSIALPRPSMPATPLGSPSGPEVSKAVLAQALTGQPPAAPPVDWSGNLGPQAVGAITGSAPPKVISAPAPIMATPTPTKPVSANLMPSAPMPGASAPVGDAEAQAALAGKALPFAGPDQQSSPEALARGLMTEGGSGLHLNPTEQKVIAAANKYGIPPQELLAIKRNETTGSGAGQVSSAGAIGPMQLMPGTARDLGVDPRNEDQNIDGGARYYAQMRQQFGDPRLAAAAYNAGPGNVASGRFPAETRTYMQRFQAQQEPLALAFNGQNSPATQPAPAGAQQAQARPQMSQVPGIPQAEIDRLVGLAKNGNSAERDQAVQQLQQYHNIYVQHQVEQAAPHWQIQDFGTDPFTGQKDLRYVNPYDPKQAPIPLSGQGTGAAGPSGGNGLLAAGVKQYNPALVGEDYMGQFRPEVQAAAKAYMRGDVLPSGNPRNNGVASIAKVVAQKYANDIGKPELADDSTYIQRRQLFQQLNSSGNSTMGGIISNAKSAFDHLGHFSQNMVDVGAVNGPNIYGGAAIGAVGNRVRSAFATPQLSESINQERNTGLRYGEEATKVYAASGGGQAERMTARDNATGSNVSSMDKAGYLKSELNLLTARLQEKEDQIKANPAGELWLQQHPIFDKRMQDNVATIQHSIDVLEGRAQPNTQSAPGQQPQGAQPRGNTTSTGIRWSVQ